MSYDKVLKGISVIVPAAGKGERMGDGPPKQYLPLVGKPMLQHVLERLLSLSPDRLVVPLSPADSIFDSLPVHHECEVVTGGATRAESVQAGLDALSLDDDDWVMVHDAARPCIRTEDIARLVETVGDDPVGGILAIPVHETVKRTDDGKRIDGTVSRDGLWLAQTPQLFRYGVLARAMESAAGEGLEVTDEASAVEWTGLSPMLVMGPGENLKVTTPEDIMLAEYYLRMQG